ncbi:hypothetical protein C8R44DRAFT_815018, partial [Mycena epipterygia]
MAAPFSPALDGTLGALEIGTVVGTFFLGILTLQTFNYYRQFPEDSKTLKITVGVLWLLDLAHTICALYGIYVLTVTFYGEPPSEFILKPPKSQAITILFSGRIDGVVQIFFGHRVRVLSGRSYVLFLCIALALFGFVCDMILMLNFMIFNARYAQVAAKEPWITLVTQTLTPTGDGIIALSMCYCLWRVRKSEFSRTRNMVDTLILWTVETTLVTSGVGILQLVLYLTRKDLAYTAPYLVKPHLFSNAMLAALNGRSRFRPTDATIITVSQPLDFESAGTSRRRDDHRIRSGNTMRSSVVEHIYLDIDDTTSKVEDS